MTYRKSLKLNQFSWYLTVSGTCVQQKYFSIHTVQSVLNISDVKPRLWGQSVWHCLWNLRPWPTQKSWPSCSKTRLHEVVFNLYIKISKTFLQRTKIHWLTCLATKFRYYWNHSLTYRQSVNFKQTAGIRMKTKGQGLDKQIRAWPFIDVLIYSMLPTEYQQLSETGRMIASLYWIA